MQKEKRLRRGEKKNETNFFFLFVTEVLNSTSFIYIYIYIAVTGRKLKKSGKKGRIVFNDNITLFFSIVYVCSSSSPSVFFFLYAVCVRAHLASANTSTRARVDR